MWNIVNFRAGLIASFRERGYRVIALAPPDEYVRRLAAMGVEFEPIEMDKQGISPARDFALLLRYWRTLRRLRPDVFLGYTAKPNVFGSLAAHALGIRVINNVAGLGTAFIREGMLTRIVRALYKLAFRKSATVFFQNSEDLDMFVEGGLVGRNKAQLLPGSGIDLTRFVPTRGQENAAEMRFLLVARLLWDKGVREFVEAARLVRSDLRTARFQLLGFLDVENRTAVPRSDVEAWVAEGIVEYLGHTDDVRPFIADADCVVLPSYREGLPRVLLEASAMGKPLIATDVPGCRHVLEDGVNGYLCGVRDARALADAMLTMMNLTPEQRRKMGAAARLKVEREFDERLVAERYLAAIEQAIAAS